MELGREKATGTESQRKKRGLGRTHRRASVQAEAWQVRGGCGRWWAHGEDSELHLTSTRHP